jgi:hypothetical protein
MFYYLYKTTNLITGKFYIGVHKSEKEFDEKYYGSGIYLQRAIKKYGIENFKTEVLSYCDSEEEMYNLEKEVVNDVFIKSPHNYNMKIGGKGGWPAAGSDKAKRNGLIIKEYWKNEEFRKNTTSKISESTKAVMSTPEMRKKISDGQKNRSIEEKKQTSIKLSSSLKNSYKQKTEEEKLKYRQEKKKIMSDPEIRKRISDGMKNSNKLVGYNNPDFRKRWKPKYDEIKDFVIDKIINTDEPDSLINSQVREKFGYGLKFLKVLNYYEDLGIINIIDKKYYRYQNKGVIRLKTICEENNENNS